MTTSRLVSRGALLPSAPRLALAGAQEFSRFGHLGTFFEGPAPERGQAGLPLRSGVWSRIFALSKSPPLHGKLYATAIIHNLENDRDGQSAFSSCPPREA